MSNSQNPEKERKIYLNTKECADLILRTQGSVRRLALTGKIPFRKPGGRLMFPLDEIEQWINGALGKTIDEVICQ